MAAPHPGPLHKGAPTDLDAVHRYLYCNMPGFELMQARPSRLYFMALGGTGDMHTPNSAESSMYLDGQRRQAVRLLAGSMLTTDVT